MAIFTAERIMWSSLSKLFALLVCVTTSVRPQALIPLADPYTSSGLEYPMTYHSGPRVGNLCASTLCLRGRQCRVVQACSTCPPQATCLNPNRIPFEADDICQARGFVQAVLLDGITTGYEVEPLRCGRRVPSRYGMSCPRGSSCEFLAPGKGRCCFGRVLRRRGTVRRVVVRRNNNINNIGSRSNVCPRITPGIMGACGGAFCTSDLMCPRQQKCCPSACGGRVCASPMYSDRSMPRRRSGCGYCPVGTFCDLVPVACITTPCDRYSHVCVPYNA
ncbi:uncharacterized protein LOC106011259 [Aplysia californica]|uniref:Uncharacterized protein LOC106011259 n=1 Tax=Aplysia californica TaxID=6500 RepID=A0ABM0ZW30_APLCA|nr:uncharacterized protein LOC106011259 [Aplysia californica]XP_012935738.1 uncharacterized protein LOC106011259 [Aplysia californica]